MLSFFLGNATAPQSNLSLWYQQPAENWMTSALPIGNGRIGAMVFGGVIQEEIQFNRPLAKFILDLDYKFLQ